MELENTTTIESPDNTVYIDAIQELKENSVDRKIYDKLKTERDQLVQTLIDGGSISTEVETKVRSLAECREAFKAKTTSQCEYMENLLALRDAAIREGQPDPFVATGHHVTPNPYSYQRAQEIADIYRECLDYADGDDKVFMNEIQRRMK